MAALIGGSAILICSAPSTAHGAPIGGRAGSTPARSPSESIGAPSRRHAEETAFGIAAIATTALIIAARRLRERAAVEAAERALEEDFRKLPPSQIEKDGGPWT